MKKLILLLLILMVLVSCKETPKAKPKEISCMSNELQQCIRGYFVEKGLYTHVEEPLDSIEYHITKDEKYLELLEDIYYTLYFFEIDTIEYFTMWQDYSPGTMLFDLSFNIFQDSLLHKNLLCYEILNRYVFIVSETNDTCNILFTVCNENMLLANEKKHIDKKLVPINDGTRSPTTYKYYKRNNEVIIEKLDIPLLYFSPGWTEFEKHWERIKKDKEKEKREVYIMRNYFATNE